MGVPVGTSQVIAALRGLALLGIERRDDVYFALRATLLTDPSQFDAFRQVFDALFDGAGRVPPDDAILAANQQRDDRSRTLGVGPGAVRSEAPRSAADEGPSVAARCRGGSSTVERLGEKDFEAMDDAEAEAALSLLRRLTLPASPLSSRRFVAAAAGARLDLRRSIRLMLRKDGELFTFAARRRRQRDTTYVLICDVSASMSAYSRMFLQFAHSVTARRRSTCSYVFGTRLTEVGSMLRTTNADRALAEVASAARDIDGGTRIARSLETFNRRWARRLPLHESTVILLSDGLERDTESDLEFQVARLHRSCRQLIWLNPMLRYAGFEPKAYGIRTMLPHVDQFLPAHSLNSFLDLARILAEPKREMRRVLR